ncbi:peritrophin-1-like [Osmia bicornis bicornis]|uniref:peritrophin-1-like n=1 Tax=Osmia bicornis bicornis TaxID=1437191 RepID=UPI0010FA4782|nr:peritrophin-1-like [Osmia bicornis bicornis]
MKGVFQFLLTLVVLLLLVISVFANAVVCPPKNEADVTLLPNPDSCKTFYLCNDGIPYLMQCPDGLDFNPEERVCDLPEQANCISSGVITTTESVSEEPPTATPSVKDTDFEASFEDEEFGLQFD